jgi:hypothetical protein
MEQSEQCISEMARFEIPTPHVLIARRAIEDTRLYRRWEVEHDRMMRTVADETKLHRQVVALRSGCFGLIHRKAMFEYLRQHRVTGRERHEVFGLIHGEQDYATSVVVEHGNYVRATLSLICATHLGLTLFEDRAFGEPLHRYEQRYADYFRVFCRSAIKSNGYNNDDTLSTLVPYLKRQLGNLRRAILELPREPEITGLHNLEIREPAANSQALAVPLQGDISSSGRVA